jgi:hypothetical protein
MHPSIRKPPLSRLAEGPASRTAGDVAGLRGGSDVAAAGATRTHAQLNTGIPVHWCRDARGALRRDLARALGGKRCRVLVGGLHTPAAYTTCRPEVIESALVPADGHLGLRVPSLPSPGAKDRPRAGAPCPSETCTQPKHRRRSRSLGQPTAMDHALRAARVSTRSQHHAGRANTQAPDRRGSQPSAP